MKYHSDGSVEFEWEFRRPDGKVALMRPIEWAMLYLKVHEMQGIYTSVEQAIDSFNRLHPDEHFYLHES